MGWWPFSSSSTPERAAEIRTGTAIPNRTERAICWTSRDALFSCLDANSIIDTTTPSAASAARKACPLETEAFERDCAKAWVKYFREKRVAEDAKNRRIEALKKEGAQEIAAGSGFSVVDGLQGGKSGPAAKTERSVQDIQDQLAKRRGS
jgi:cytochrome c oxidase assembly factor 6